jgi:predicted NBD/HSP70 family sugar kinase
LRTLSGKPQLLKEVNSSMIEHLVFENGPLSKPDLTKLTGLSLPTINKLVDDLEKNARLCSVGRSGKGAGRKAMLYETNRNSGCILSCYYQDGSYRCRLVDMLNKTLHEKLFPLDCSSFKRAIESTFNTIDALIELAPASVKIIGIGLPGVIRSDGRLLGIPQIAVWEDFNLRKALINRYNTTFYIENNVNLSAMGYYYTYLREKQENILYLYVGNGIGSGIIINRHLYLGSGNFAGEIAFMAEPGGATDRNYAAVGGYLESRMGLLVDFATGELRQNCPARRKELVVTLGTIVVNHVAVLNPGVIVLAGKIFDKSLVEEIKRHMGYYLHTGIMPRITRDLGSSTGLDGLVQSCRDYITTGVHLVQSTGLPESRAKIAV